MRNFLVVLIATVSLSAYVQVSVASERDSSIDLDALVAEAQELVFANPLKLDSVISIIERNSLQVGDSSYFAAIRSMQGVRASMQNDYGPALKYFYDVFQRSKRLNYTATQRSALINMSGVCQMSGRYRDAKSRLNTALALTDESDEYIAAKIIMGIGQAEAELNQFDSAVTNFRKAIALF